MANGAEMPIFTRTYDYLTWLLPLTNHFPRAHRFTFTTRLLNAAFELREFLEEAQHITPFASRREKRRDLFRCCLCVRARNTYIEPAPSPGHDPVAGQIFWRLGRGEALTCAHATHETAVNVNASPLLFTFTNRNAV